MECRWEEEFGCPHLRDGDDIRDDIRLDDDVGVK